MMGDVRQFPQKGRLLTGAADSFEAPNAQELQEIYAELPAAMEILEDAVKQLSQALAVLLYLPLDQWEPLQHKFSFIAIGAATKAARLAAEIADDLWLFAPEPLPDVQPAED